MEKNALFQSGQNMGDMMMFKVSKLTIGTQTDIGYSVSMTYSSLLDKSYLESLLKLRKYR
ncbi:hypothetical protein M892_25920 [Vibrio campbellii ATCC BAA-1116]|uniref:Uncharacterized protein n=1 Tax=Vibrio campbellii (strain ATCC BAA-1116) TaxID=2902295 RepID=A7N378_VIBC1|nr:hypothetical protein VIBHAR_05060 [Vibrio campbellii ATCC BAA-1116]AGU98826.1 hypothetical protein M892_25920 [Vibrio campbellii ATCC BAA-1116]